MGNLETYAKEELERAGMFDKDSDYAGGIGDAVMELIKVFAAQGHSGGSAPRVVHLFEKLANYKPILPIEDNPEDWVENSFGILDDNTFQNKRLGSLFKDGENGRAHYLDAIVFRGNRGGGFTSGSVMLSDGTSIGSSQYVKFPFIPKTFYIDVIETEWADKEGTIPQEGGGWWSSVVKDESQLDEVFKYYDRKL